MINYNVRLRARRVIGRMRRMHRDTPKVIAQELNKQQRAVKGGTGRSKTIPVIGLPRRLKAAWGVSIKRLRKRVVLPRAGWAKPRRLRAGGLMLFESMPARYFAEPGIPSGATVIPLTHDASGREFVGQPFQAKMRSGAEGQFRRVLPKKHKPKRQRSKPQRDQSGRFVSSGKKADKPTNHLPINWAFAVDASEPAYRHRAEMLNDLARVWPGQILGRLRREFRGLFRA